MQLEKPTGWFELSAARLSKRRRGGGGGVGAGGGGGEPTAKHAVLFHTE